MNKSLFEKETLQFGDSIKSLIWNISSIKDALKHNTVADVIFYSKYGMNLSDKLYDFLEKYNLFFEILRKKFGLDISACNSLKMDIGETKRKLQQVIIFASEGKMDFATRLVTEIDESYKQLYSDHSKVVTLPYLIDYEKLENKEWRSVGIAGIHYKSKVFLSYHFRDDDPKKDENQQIIDYYIKPLFDSLEVELVTARGSLKPQELIDDKIIELIEDCDGIIGLYTVNDDVSNVEHELAYNPNIIVICKEEDATAPSMRYSRLMVNFNRETGLGNLLLGLILALKTKELFIIRGSFADAHNPN